MVSCGKDGGHDGSVEVEEEKRRRERLPTGRPRLGAPGAELGTNIVLGRAALGSVGGKSGEQLRLFEPGEALLQARVQGSSRALLAGSAAS